MRRPTLHPRTGRAPRAVLALLLAAALSSPAAAGTTAAPAPSSASSTRHSPGWYPVVDPESSSVRLGRRANAPAVSMPFRGGTRSLDELGRSICRMLHHRDRDSLLALCVTDQEFRTILWREFPQSRPATGLQWEDGWRVLDMRLRSGIADALGDHGGRVFEFLRFEREGGAQAVTRYRNFTLHNGLVMVVRDDAGAIQRFGWFRSAAERNGRFKIYSLRD